MPIRPESPRLSITTRLEYDLTERADVLLQIEAAAGADQMIEHGQMLVSSDVPLVTVPGEEAIGRRTWISAEGALTIEYHADVTVLRPALALDSLAATSPREWPALVIPYVFPSRYVESASFESFVTDSFGDLRGGALVAAQAAWIADNIRYCANSTKPDGTATTTFVERAGVCRDFAHLMAALARAGGIPARVVSVYAPDVVPQDFHAVVEVWLEGGWHLVDATGMARADEMVRIGVGRDATDIAFMTIFGTATMRQQSIEVSRSWRAPDLPARTDGAAVAVPTAAG